MRVLVCGGREFDDQPFMDEILNKLHARTPISLLIHGAARGADSQAEVWAKKSQVPYLGVPAEWFRHGRSAGHLRNKDMLDWDPELVIAFPGGAGTENMVSQALTFDNIAVQFAVKEF